MVIVKKRILVSVTLAAFVGAIPCVAQDVFSSISQEVQTVFENSKAAVVRVRGDDGHGTCIGSGFFVDPSGTLYTHYTVGGETENLTVEIGDRKYPATRLVADRRSGIAILKVDNAPPLFLPIGSSRELKVASPVVAIGYPMDLGVSPSFGMVSGFDIKYLNHYLSTTHIRANVIVHKGEGGAPLVDTQGKVVGIVMSPVDSGNACFALPIEAAEKIRNDYLRYGEVRRGFLGITIGRAPVIDSDSQVRVKIGNVESPAAEAGLRRGDYITKVGQVELRQPEDFLDASFFLTSGEPVSIEIVRDKQPMKFAVTPVLHPNSDRPKIINRSSPDQNLSIEPQGQSLLLNQSN